MGERKVLNKYIPADFDPSLVPRGKKLSSKDGTVPVRMMLPFSMQCSSCNTFLYRGRKFNSKKEPMGGPAGRYLGIQRWRFYIKCTACSRPVTFLTDPKNADYEMESGATRNYEVYKDKESKEGDADAEKLAVEKDDPMKALENRVLDSQREMADLDNLEEIKAMNAQHVRMMNNSSASAIGEDHDFDADAKAILRRAHHHRDGGGGGNDQQGAEEDGRQGDDGTSSDLLTAEDEALVKSIRFGGTVGTGDGDIIRRLDEEDERRLEERRKREAAAMEERLQQALFQSEASSSGGGGGITEKSVMKRNQMPIVKVKRKKRPVAAMTTTTTTTNNSNNNNNNTASAASWEAITAPKKKIKETKELSSSSLSKTVQTAVPVQRPEEKNSTGLAGLLGGYGSSSSSSNSD